MVGDVEVGGGSCFHTLHIGNPAPDSIGHRYPFGRMGMRGVSHPKVLGLGDRLR